MAQQVAPCRGSRAQVDRRVEQLSGMTTTRCRQACPTKWLVPPVGSVRLVATAVLVVTDIRPVTAACQS
jgi:hypothetical protein